MLSSAYLCTAEFPLKKSIFGLALGKAILFHSLLSCFLMGMDSTLQNPPGTAGNSTRTPLLLHLAVVGRKMSCPCSGDSSVTLG